MSVLENELNSDRENTGDNGAPPPHSNRERLTVIEVQRRVDECFNLRFESEKPILQRQWVDHCKDKYGDKSIPTYLHYWNLAKQEYDERWKGTLEGLLQSAVEKLQDGLNSENHYVRSKTIDQIMKFSGNDIQKHQVLLQNINIGFGEE